MKRREIIEQVRGKNAVDGAGVHLVRVLGIQNVKDFDPFLMLDSFDSRNPEDYIAGFPFHPHRGIETVTYLISGEMEHKDSLGNKGVIKDGECQWMTAGSGIMHEEMPKPAKERMLGLQLWVNLPKKDKMAEPKYFDITKDMVETVNEENADIKVVSGAYKDLAHGVNPDYVDVTLLDIDVKPNETFTIDTREEDNVFVFLIEGTASINETDIETKTAVRFGAGDHITLKAGEKGVRVMYFGGKPLKEPIAWAGPIVMNTQEELKNTFEELNNGTFIKHEIKK